MNLTQDKFYVFDVLVGVISVMCSLSVSRVAPSEKWRRACVCCVGLWTSLVESPVVLCVCLYFGTFYHCQSPVIPNIFQFSLLDAAGMPVDGFYG